MHTERPAPPFPASLATVTAEAPAEIERVEVTDAGRAALLAEQANDLMEEKREIETKLLQQNLLYRKAVERLEQVVRTEQRPVGLAETVQGTVALCANGSAWHLGYDASDKLQWSSLPPIPGSPAAIFAAKELPNA